MYRVGFKPWDKEQIPDPVREVVEGPEAPPPGRALDLGCGTGTQSVYLAQHGWDVIGIDFVSRPLAQARGKALAACKGQILSLGVGSLELEPNPGRERSGTRTPLTGSRAYEHSLYRCEHRAKRCSNLTGISSRSRHF
jgi:SAM-dependent methyltransferase